MSVIKRGNKWYAMFWYRDPVTGARKRYRKSLGANVSTKSEARQREAELRLELAKPPPEPGPVRKTATFAAFAMHWLELDVVPNRKPGTVRSYMYHLEHYLIPRWEARDLRTLTGEDVAELRATLSKTLSPKSVSNVCGTLSKMMSCAVAWGYRDENPAKGASSPPRKTSREIKFWTQVEVEVALADTEDRPVHRATIALGCLAGLRAGEMCGLDWSAVNLEAGKIRVAQQYSSGRVMLPKHDKVRVVPIPGRLVGILRRLPRRLHSDHVITNDAGERRSPQDLWLRIQQVIRRTGVPRISVHGLRHTYASHLVMRGVPLLAVKEYLGHSSMHTTMRYAHLQPDALASYVHVLDEVGREEGTG